MFDEGDKIRTVCRLHGPLGSLLGVSWGPLGDLLGSLGASWGPLGGLLGALWGLLGRFGVLLGTFWAEKDMLFVRGQKPIVRLCSSFFSCSLSSIS